MTKLGISFSEGVSSDYSVRTPATSNVGLLVQATRGVPFTPIKVKSYEEFLVIFGEFTTSFYGPSFVKYVFDEAGESTPISLMVARVVGSGSVTASGSKDMTGSTMTVKAAYKGMDDPGVWGNSLSVKLYTYGFAARNSFTLRIYYKGVLKETFYGDSLAEIQRNVLATSKWASVKFTAELPKDAKTDIAGTITTTLTSNVVTGATTQFTTDLVVGSVLFDKTSGKQIGTVESIQSATSLTLTGKAMLALTAKAAQKRNDVEHSVTLTGGVTGDVVESDFYPVESFSSPKGLACFNDADVQVIACTEFHSLSLAKEVDKYVTNKANPIGLVNLPINSEETTAELWALELQKKDSSFTAAYFQWLETTAPTGDTVLLPYTAAAIGAGFVRTLAVNGGYANIPPAGTDSTLKKVLRVIPPLSKGSMSKIALDFCINVNNVSDVYGNYIGSSRLLSLNEMFQSIHIRQQTSYYKRYLDANFRKMEQRLNTSSYRNGFLVELRTFFKGEYDRGALENSLPFEKSYSASLEVSPNRKNLLLKIKYVPSECVEAIEIVLERNDGIYNEK